MKPEQNTQSTAVRRPEDTSRAAHLAFSLHASVSRPRAFLSWRARAEAEGEALAHLEERVRQRVLTAMARAVDADTRARLVAIARTSAFGRLDVRVQAAALDALAEGAIDRALAADVERAVEELEPLEASPAERFLMEMIGRRSSTEDRAAFLELLASDGFLQLERSKAVELLRLLGGPRSKIERRVYLEQAWSRVRSALRQLLREEEYTRALPIHQAGMLVDFLSYPSQPLYFLEAMVFGGRSIVILGDPADPTAISYGQIPVVGPAQRRTAILESPEACHASAWSCSEEATFTYSYRVFQVSHDEMRRFVEWAESAFMTEHCASSAKRFFDAGLAVAKLYAQRTDGQFDTGYLQRGERCTVEQEIIQDRAHDEMLARFLAA